VEELGQERVSVFLPSVPAVTLGQLQIVPASRITVLNAPMKAVAESLAMYGEGLGSLVRGEGSPGSGAPALPAQGPGTGAAPAVSSPG
jgi:hypothetical protein